MAFFRFWAFVPWLMVLKYVCADTELYIPGFDPQPLSAANVGEDGQGRTTWELVPGALTGTWEEPAFVGTATLVEGPNDAHLSFENSLLSVSLDISCAIVGGVASCTAGEGYDSTPFPFPPETVVPFLVQGGGSASPAANTQSPTNPPSAAPSEPSSGSPPSSASPPLSAAPQSSGGTPSPAATLIPGTAFTSAPGSMVLVGLAGALSLAVIS